MMNQHHTTPQHKDTMTPRKLDRRNFVRLTAAASAAAASSSLFAQKPVSATLRFNSKPVAVVPLDFTGLSYESPQLMNPAFFSPENASLVQLYRNLSPHGVLRTGGNLSAFTAWHNDPAQPTTPAEQLSFDQGKKYWEWDLTDPSIRNGKREAIFTPASIQTLAAFLEATGWKLIYGLNFATGTPQQAAAEAACVQRLVGKNLIAFQLGNELDFWAGGFRPRSWSFDTFYAQWSDWVRIIRASAPNAPFAGPDVAIRLDWVEQLAQKQQQDLALLSKHHYAMGPAGDPRMDARHLLGPDPDIQKEIDSAQRAKAIANVSFRNTECNSCFHGGQPGVSDAYASALWAADYMLTLAHGGHAGVNLHGGGEGIYSPIVGHAGSEHGITARPLYYGMQFAQSFAGATMLEATLSASNINATAFAATHNRETLVALINKDALPLSIALDKKSLAGLHLSSIAKLSAPSLNSLTGVTFDALDAAALTAYTSNIYELAPYTALLLRFQP
jgi:hypothetical protein